MLNSSKKAEVLLPNRRRQYINRVQKNFTFKLCKLELARDCVKMWEKERNAAQLTTLGVQNQTGFDARKVTWALPNVS